MKTGAAGGNMRPEHYADEYRRYQTYVRNYAGNQPIQKVCCGPNVDDYEWTKKLWRHALTIVNLDSMVLWMVFHSTIILYLKLKITGI